MSNITTIRFCGNIATAPALYQYDYGQRLVFQNIELPSVYEVHFANACDADTITALGDDSGVVIPDELLLKAGMLYAYIYLHTRANDGETEYKATIPVLSRARPSDTQPTPVQQDIIEQAIAKLTEAVEDYENITTATEEDEGKALTVKTVEDGKVTEWEFKSGGGGGGGTTDYTDLDNKPKINNVTLAGNKTASDLGLIEASDITASKSGDTTTIYVHGVAIATVKDGINGQDGDDGYSPSASVSKSGDTATISITDKDGTTTAIVTDGQDGRDGTDGQDGYSPTASVSKAGTTATITITDKNGTTTAQVSDGTDGQDGQDGDDGFSPTATVTKSGTTATISITDKNGTTTAQISDGTDGQDGTDGHSPVVTASKTGKVTTVSVDGTPIATINDGNDGTTPIKGTDYWTAQDQAAIVQDVVTDISPTMQTKAITDTGGYYTTDTVEGALQEIGAEIAGVNTLIGTGVIS